MDTEHENDLLKENHVLILGALKKCHITSYHPMFEDYLQIARWVLIDTHRYFLREGKSLTSFNNYVYQRIYWKITDEIRKDLAFYGACAIEDEDTSSDLETQIADAPQEDLLEIKDLLFKLEPKLTTQEKNYLEDAFFNELPISDIAKKYNVSRQTVYNWRDKVAIKYLLFFK